MTDSTASILVPEHWTSSTLSIGFSRVHWPVLMCFVDLDQEFNRCPRGIWWGLLWDVGLFDRSRSLFHIAGTKYDLRPVHVGLRLGCTLLPALFIIFMERNVS